MNLEMGMLMGMVVRMVVGLIPRKATSEYLEDLPVCVQ